MRFKQPCVAFISIVTASHVLAATEIKSNFLPSFAAVGKADIVFSSHNTILFGTSGFYFGPYGAWETISENVTDHAYGAALRIGEKTFAELQGGYFQRNFSQEQTKLKGNGFIANLGVGTHLNDVFGVTVFASGKRIESGTLDKRWIVDLLPFLNLRTVF